MSVAVSPSPSGGSPSPSPSGSGPSPSPSPSANPTSFALTLPPGGATITQPPQTATSFFKIAPNALVTFGWNLTSVLGTPSSITFAAVCTENGNTYTIGSVDGKATNIVWDVFAYQQANPETPLAEAEYTLHMYDERGPSATIAAGLMSPNDQLQFALYTPQPYTPLASGWTCTGCSGALATRPQAATFALLVTLLVGVLSAVGVLRRRV
ncbi:hypothetical protein HMN09_00365800 [Mycena chlorophos]|uniref:DUF7137 domain-containing protein n=1 Tax=Mycena chlorophos TaxID=658473 RepID=A0A8H6TJ88_MYCCL|nr:hypothetical protein HMN09_00365800 [Mycena chlorophos]